MDEDETLLPAELPDQPWMKLSEKGKQAIKLSNHIHGMKHGLFASIPIICRAQECPYRETCLALASDLAPEGESCPVEVAMIMKLYEDYTTSLQIDTSQIVNLGLVKDLVEAEITIARCNAILAKDGNIIQDSVVSVTPQGRSIMRQEPHVALGIRDNAKKVKANVLQLLNSTPKDKARSEGVKFADPSSYAVQIRRMYEKEQERLKKEEEVKIIDVTPERTENEDHEGAG